MKQFYGAQNEMLLNTSFDMDRVVIFLPGISGKAHSGRFAWVDDVADEAGYASARLNLWEDAEQVNIMTYQEIFTQLDVCIAELQQLGFIEIVMIGKSFGGGVTLMYSHKIISKKIMLAPAISCAEVGNLEEMQSIKLGEVSQLLDIKVPAAQISADVSEMTIIHGTADDMFPVSNSEAIITATTNGKLITIPDADHSFKTPEMETALIGAVRQVL